MKALQYGDKARELAAHAVNLNNCGRYLLVDILRPEAECTNGVSSRRQLNAYTFSYFVPCVDGNWTLAEIEKLNEGECRSWIVPTRVIFDVLAPAFDDCPLRFKVRGETRQTMAGGNFAYTSDSRFSETYGAPISIHDRTEG